MRPFLAVSNSPINWVIIILGLSLLSFLWISHNRQYEVAHKEALEARATEHQNLAIIITEHLGQIADRAQALGQSALGGQWQPTALQRNLSRILAQDPIFNRITLYDAKGNYGLSSHQQSRAQLPPAWMKQVRKQLQQYGNTVFLPTQTNQKKDTPNSTSSTPPEWKIPFLLPVVDGDSKTLTGVLYIEMDVGYLTRLYQDINLGQSGIIQLLDRNNVERLRTNHSGVLVSGPDLIPLNPPDRTVITGRFQSASQAGLYQSLLSRKPELGWTVVVSQQYGDILAPIDAREQQQKWIYLLLTGVVIGVLAWLLKMINAQQETITALNYAQDENQALIERLETAHRRSSLAASTDHLSGLFNRRQLMDIGARVITEQRACRKLLAVLFIDLDRFKSINDTLGHKTGDLLLQAVAGRIKRLLEPGDYAARFGGDEFVILLAGDRTETSITNWVQTLVARLSDTYALDGTELNTSPSVGVSICPRDAQSIDELIRCADNAMYSAKQSGRGQYRFYDPSLNTSSLEAFQIEQSLIEALKKHQLVLHYQPMIDLDTMKIVGYESLVRWQHPDHGMIYPDRFIAIAERSGLIVELGETVLRLACEQLSVWRKDGCERHISINVSALQLASDHFSSIVLDSLKAFQIPPSMIDLEITETAILNRPEKAIHHLERLRRHGIGISLDDFGHGYAGFAHLYNLPITKLKIDRKLIAPLSNRHDDSPIVSSTIALAKKMNLQVVAEGVETLEQVVYLKLAGCDLAQGYHFSRPLDPKSLLALEASFAGEHATLS
ncbi:MAG: GGDEF-domain containing protein [Pusillimonas sp.]|nr:GGDEF-domain containing protein [Pusillimonas sp.]MBC43551.1 GGDEF-domain containing protein [Pusillimonas sp.]